VRFRFESTVVDGDRRLLTRDGVDVHVAPKTLDFLLLLAERAPNAVSKAELMAALCLIRGQVPFFNMPMLKNGT